MGVHRARRTDACRCRWDRTIIGARAAPASRSAVGGFMVCRGGIAPEKSPAAGNLSGRILRSVLAGGDLHLRDVLSGGAAVQSGASGAGIYFLRLFGRSGGES